MLDKAKDVMQPAKKPKLDISTTVLDNEDKVCNTAVAVLSNVCAVCKCVQCLCGYAHES